MQDIEVNIINETGSEINLESLNLGLGELKYNVENVKRVVTGKNIIEETSFFVSVVGLLVSIYGVYSNRKKSPVDILRSKLLELEIQEVEIRPIQNDLKDNYLFYVIDANRIRYKFLVKASD